MPFTVVGLEIRVFNRSDTLLRDKSSLCGTLYEPETDSGGNNLPSFAAANESACDIEIESTRLAAVR